MPRARDPNRDKAFEIWKESKGEKLLKDIAAELGVSDTQIRKWKSQDKWEQTKGNVTNSKSNVTKQEEYYRPVIQSDELNDKKKLFCLYYTKYFNATKAYQKAYDCSYLSAKAHGYKLLQNVAVKKEIERLKAEQQRDLFLEGKDILQKYVDIAFADITDFAVFGKKEVQAMGAFGPLVDEDKNPIMVEVNYVDFKDSTEVDGTIITEVKKGKDGVSVKLADKLKALEKLSLYFDLFPDNFKRQIEEEKLKIAHHKAFGANEDEEYEDDGFLAALDGKEVNWDEEA